MKFTIAILTICFTILSMGANASEVAQNTIKIDSKEKVLIAPESSSYKWFYNGQALSFSEREVKIALPGTYEVETVDQYGETLTSTIKVSVNASGNVIRIFTIGDSTVANYSATQYPWAGWGQILNLFFDPSKVTVNNRARGGRSSRSFYEEGIWESVKAELVSGDYVFVQFGHNDRDYSNASRYTTPENMKTYLRIYINDSREKGAIPVLVSPMSMNTGTRNVFTESGSDYRGAMLAVSQELNVPFLDLNIRSYNFYQQIGTEYASYFIHMGLSPGEYSNYPDGYTDTYTHYQEMGALAMARMVTLEIQEKKTNSELAPLADALKPLYNVAVAIKNSAAAMVTISGDYPAGATVTLKARNIVTWTMKNWNDTINNITLNGNLVTFTMAAHDYDFVGNLVDCNGTAYGTAIYDNCGICTGGTTKLDPCSNIIRFSDFCETNTNAEVNLDKTPYKLYLRTDSVANAYITQQFNVAKTDSIFFAASYYNPTSATIFNIYVNDTLRVKNLVLTKKPTWDVVKFYLHLIKGQNTIKIVPKTLSLGVGASLDYLAIYSQDILKENCVASIENKIGTFFQKDSLIVIEAENYNKSKAAKNGTKWMSALFDNASNRNVVVSPAGTTYAAAGTAQSDAPVLRYNVDFPHAGNYSVWARVYAFDANGDSYHLGLNSEVMLEKIDLTNSTKVYKDFTWLHVATAKLTILNSGVKGLDLFCNEPNLIIDKLILTLDENYSPLGAGPEQTLNPADTLDTGVNDIMMNNQDLQISVYPNPAQDQIRIAYNMAESNFVNISIENMNGQVVANLFNDYQSFGKHEFTWNLNNSVSHVNPGLYLVRFQIGNSFKIQKLIVIH
ncbi:MAG: GDSL-type esterase/lipase family protein [Paludibacter sp.]|nr:GDSL-type esterase/lipase family protein [Paludibacter sp.]